MFVQYGMSGIVGDAAISLSLCMRIYPFYSFHE